MCNTPPRLGTDGGRKVAVSCLGTFKSAAVWLPECHMSDKRHHSSDVHLWVYHLIYGSVTDSTATSENLELTLI